MKVFRRVTILIAGFVLVAGAAPASAAPGDLVASFGQGGIVTAPAAQGGDTLNGVDANNGKIIGAGITKRNGSDDAFLIRFRPGGAIDHSFSSDGRVVTGGSGDQAWADHAVLPDGSIVTVGPWSGGSETHTVLAKFAPDGSLDSAFGHGGILHANLSPTYDSPEAMVRMGTTFWVVGQIGQGAGADMFVARFSAKGKLDKSFGAGGIRRIDVGGGEDEATTLHRASDGGMIIGGWTIVGGISRMALANVNSAGNLDSGFGTGGSLAFSSGGAFAGYDLSVEPDAIYLGGSAVNGPTFDAALAKFSSNGTPDLSFDGDALRTYPLAPGNNAFYSVYAMPAGVVAVGSGDNGANSDFLLMRVDAATGAPDTTFGGGDGLVLTDIAGGSDGALDTVKVGDTLFLGGYANAQSTSISAIAKYNLT